MNYEEFLCDLDKKLSSYFARYRDYVQCKKGCSSCCENGDYPLSQLELELLMQGYIALSDNTKKQVQENIKNIKKGGVCPFLVNSNCSIYKYRPIVCRVHGLAYLTKNNIVKLPYCTNNGKNFAKVYSDGKVSIEPIDENLDTPSLLKEFDYGEIRNLYDWLQK